MASLDFTFMYASARAHLDGAMLIERGSEGLNRDYFILPTHTLLGLSIETLLKAVLLKLGVPQAELQSRKYGHNLKHLKERALELGFQIQQARVGEIIDRIGDDYANHRYRYLRNDSVLNPVSVPVAVKYIDEFMDQIALFLGIPVRPTSVQN